DRAACLQESAAGVFARALERLYRYNVTPAVLQKRLSVHPDLYDRLVSAGLPPEYPRPALPSPVRGFLATVAVLSPLMLAPFVWTTLAFVDADREQQVLWTIAATGGRADDLGELGLAREARGDVEGAATFYRAAQALDGRSHAHTARLALLLARGGRCPEAAAAVAQAAVVGGDTRDDPWIRTADRVVRA